LEARAQYPGLGVLILSAYVEPVYTAELLDSGGDGGIGYLLKERVGDVKAFIAAVESVANGGTALDREVVSELVRQRTGNDQNGALAALTPREREVLHHLARGYPYKRIGARLNISARTVETRMPAGSSTASEIAPHKFSKKAATGIAV
jgi:DNA-binding NarL/FixJ family response regulator